VIFAPVYPGMYDGIARARGRYCHNWRWRWWGWQIHW